MNQTKQIRQLKLRRAARVRARISGTADKPRLAVFRSNRGMYAQLIDDEKGNTLAAVWSKSLKTQGVKTSVAEEIGKTIAEKASALGIKSAVLDRRGYQYHGRVKALTEGARKAGLKI